MNSTHHAYSFEGKYCGAKKYRQLLYRSEERAFCDSRETVENVVVGDGDAGDEQEVGEHGEGGEVLETAQEVEQDQGWDQKHHVDLQGPVQLPVVLYYLSQQDII